MKPSIWTSMYYEQSPVQALETLAAQGWQAFELSCEHLGMLAGAGPKAVGAYASAMESLRVEVPQCHATILANVASLDEYRRSSDMAAIHRDIDLCAELGVRNIVIHPGGDEAPDRATLDRVTTLRLKSFAELAGHCERVGTRLAIENMSDGGSGVWGKRRFGAIVEEILELTEQIGSPALGVCLDTSHANMQGLNQPAAIRACGDKLIALHVSDNDGSGDQHRAPGYGSVPFPEIVAALREIGYPFNFNLEIPGECHAPRPIVDLRSTYALRVCDYLLQG
jgi:sugar phosphate isomerase/epimerase